MLAIFGIGTLADGEIHVWTARCRDDDSLTHSRLALLDTEERVRAGRLVERRQHMRFIQFRAFARHVLGGYLGVPAAEVALAVGPNGKPLIERRARDPALHFNISHAGDWCLLAARRGGAVGVDIEQVRDIPDVLAIARRFFTRSEAELLAHLDGGARRDAFFALWTHKEAAVKALGESLADNLDRLEFALDPTGHARLDSSAATRPALAGLWVRRLDAPAGHVATLASLHPCAKIMAYTWSEIAPDAIRASDRAAPQWFVPQGAPWGFICSREASDHPRGA
jgi:4'-phosphopantetheinyl transferase